MEIQNLLSYYLECASNDIDVSIREFQISYDKKYESITRVPNNLQEIIESKEKGLLEIIEKVKRDKNKLMLYVGYPIYVDKKKSKNGKEYGTVEPLFLIPISDNVLSFDQTKINKSFIENLLGLKSNVEIISHVMDILRDIGYFSEEIDYKKCIENIYNERPDYPFKEKIDIENISTRDIEKINIKGIYNNAGIFVAEKSKYTEGLEKELMELKTLMKIKTGSVLEELVASKGYIENNKVDNNDKIKILETLAMNDEQREAIKKALSSKITLIKGPPGTGKSQVVTNLIINAAYNNKTVLFSSKNHKAVDVVCERLNKTSKYPVIFQMRSTSDINTSIIPYLENLLNSNVRIDNNYYNAITLALGNKKNKIDKINLEIQEILERNAELKKIENEVEEIKKQIIDLNIFRKNAKIYLDDCYIKLNNIEEQIKLLQSKNIINKIKISFNKKNINIKIKNYIREYNILAEKISLKNKVSVYDSENVENLYIEIKNLKEIKNQLYDLKKYFELVDKNNLADNIVDAVNKLNELKQDYILMSQEVWDKFMEKKSLDILYEDKQNLLSYKVMLNMIVKDPNVLMNKSFLNNYNTISYKINKIIPSIAVTSLSVRGKYPLNPASIDLLVIDEASQCDIASAIPLLYRAKSVVVIGDLNQLEHITMLNSVQNIELLNKYSLMNNLAWDYKNNSIYSLIDSYLKEEDKISLKEHHRSHGDIINFSNKYFYNNILRIATKYTNLTPLRNASSISIVEAIGETKKYNGSSAYNEKEIEIVIEKLKQIINSNYKGSIGIVTPFRAQAEAIQKRIDEQEELNVAIEKNNLLVDTVNKFQGDERDVIIFSPCIAQGISDGAISFLKNTKKLFNVAITRAKANLILVCDSKYIENSSVEYFKDFIIYLKELENKKTEENKLRKILENTNGIYPKLNELTYTKYEKYLYEKLFENGITTIPKYKVDNYYIDLAIINDKNKIAIIIEKEGESLQEQILLINKLIAKGYIVKKIYTYQINDSLDYIIDEINKIQRT